MARDFEPWQGPQFDSIRRVKPIYPPAFEFSYTVVDSKNRVVKQGKESVGGLNFQERATRATDPLFFEKNILSEWIRNNLKGLK